MSNQSINSTMGSICNRSETDIQLAPKKPTCLEDLNYNPGIFIHENQQSFHEVYQLASKSIGKGLYGEIRLCVHKKLNIQRAVKIIRKDSQAQENIDKAWILREVEIFKTLDHPEILRLYEFFESFDKYYLVMEYFDGGDLYSRLTELHKLEEKQVSFIMKQIFSAVQYLHSKGIIHRDLKPENILLQNKEEGDWSLKIIDFDTAVFCSVDSQIKGMMGSIYYIAPEVFDGFYNEKCDLWSCGVIMYVLLSGNPPFSGLSSYQIASRIRKGKYSLEGEIWSHISQSAKDLINQLLSKDPKKRISAANAYKDPWVKGYSQECRNTEEIQKLVQRLGDFNRTTKLKEAIQTFILTQVMMSKELNQVEKLFKEIDIDGDGVISKSELMEYLVKLKGEEEALEETEKVFEKFQEHNRDYIEYIEFLRVTVESKIWLSRENLRKAFLIFDQNSSGTISRDEVLNILSGGLELDDHVKEHFLEELFGEKDFEMTMQYFQEILIEKLSSRKCTN